LVIITQRRENAWNKDFDIVQKEKHHQLLK